MFSSLVPKSLSFSALFALAVTFLFGFPDLAMAQQTLGDMACNATANTGSFFGPILSCVAYAAGALFTVQGIGQLRGHSENPQNYPLHKGLMLLCGAALLLTMPAVVGVIIQSLYTSGAGGGNYVIDVWKLIFNIKTNAKGWVDVNSCSPGAVSTATVGLDEMMASFISNIKGPIEMLCSGIAISCGLFMIVRGLVKASKYGYDPKTHSIHSILSHIIFGALLMTTGDNLSYFMSSLGLGGGDPLAPNAASVLEWGFVSGVGGGSQQFANAIAASLSFVQIIGVIAFVRGWLVLKKAVDGHGQASLAQGLTHLIGGVLAINIVTWLNIMDTTFGTNLLGG